MWRVLSVNGTIVIVDHNTVVDWLDRNSSKIFGKSEYNVVKSWFPIECKDQERSNSLVKLQKNGVPLYNKLFLQKKPRLTYKEK